ncbi:PepSY domain-containing protein [Oceanibium sediminis]|uniref:PepSY domain-containing protein n=1 Tax=Oceanibium sediminis TaxID=2026339 RepID=UPI000DD3C1B9|nr:PepSY domain-containing protein [Oceanibium sediminis]
MKKTLTILGLLAVFPAGAALADDDCVVPIADWQPREAVARLAEQNGWTVARIKIDDGCYEIDGRDAEGRPIEVTIDPAKLTVIEIEYEDEDDDDDDDDDDRGDANREGGDDD